MGILHTFEPPSHRRDNDFLQYRTLQTIAAELGRQSVTLKRIELLLAEAAKTPEQKKAEARERWEKEIAAVGLLPEDFAPEERP